MKVLKKLTTALTAFALGVMTLATTGVLAKNVKTIASTATQVERDKERDIFANLLNASVVADDDIVELDEDSFVDVIVKTKGDALASKVSGNQKLSEYVNTTDGVKAVGEILATQTKVKNSINKLGLAYKPEYKYSYTNLFNGFAMTVKVKDIKSISKISGVEGVYLSQIYSLDASDVVSYDANGTSTGRGEMNGTDLEYTGSGMVAAIIDTGLMVDHEAFSDEFYTGTPALASADVEAVLASLNAKERYETVGEGEEARTLTVADVVVGNKVAYAFDYADNDCNVTPSFETLEEFGNGHGTHVAGTVAGNNGVDFFGIAKDAQLAIFKVFSDNDNGAATVDILAAIEDATLLGVDTINMSLGSASGFSFYEPMVDDTDTFTPIDAIYEATVAQGISLCVSAGNSYSSSYGGMYGNYGTTSGYNIGSIGSPSSYPASLTVASIDTLNVAAYKLVSADGSEMYYNESVKDQTNNVYGDFMRDFCNANGKGTYEYVDCGLGSAEEFAAVDVTGKIALVQRGSLSFQDKAFNALNAGAIACVIYNNAAGALSPVAEAIDVTDEEGNVVTEYSRLATYPICAVTKEYGDALAAADTKTLTVDPANQKTIPDMSIFSSWGDVNLKLKPEITAPGGEVWSSYPYADAESNKYVLMSGTSMASPNTAGSTVVVKQYVREVLGVVDPVLANTLTYQLLMGTATVVANEDGNVYSPRKQGAGLVNLAAATTTKQYITVDGTDRVKLELGKDASKTGVYEMTFNLVNMDEANAANYDISTLVMGLDTNNGVSLEKFDYVLSDSLVEYSVAGDGSLAGSVVTVNANGTAKVTVTVTLSDDVKNFYDLCFKYGTYIEGFVSLTGDVTLSVPFLAFYGDYDASPAFDIAPWEEVMDYGQDFISKDGLTVTSLFLQNGKFYTIDQSTFAEEVFNFKKGYEPAPFDGTFVINGAVNQNSNFGTFYGIYSYQFSMLKNVDYQEFSVYDKVTGENLLPFDYNYFLRQSYFLPQYSAFNSYTYSDFYAYMNQLLPDYMKNNMEFEVVMDAEWTGSDGLTYFDSQSIDIVVDQELSTMLDHKITQEGDKYYLEVTYWDNYFVQAICLYDAEFNSYFDVASTATEKNQVVTQKIDITDIYDDAAANGGFYLGFVDYAFNENDYVIEIGAEAEPTSYALNQNTVNVTTAEGTPDPGAPEFVVNASNVLTAYNGEGGNVVIPDGVVAIANGVFAGNETVGSVTLPASLKRIGENAFNNCPNLRYVVCKGDAVPVLVGGAFTENGYLAYTTFTNSITEFVSPSEETKSIGNVKFVMLKDLKTNPSYDLFVSKDVLTTDYVKDFNTNLPKTYEVGAHWMADFTDVLAGQFPAGTFAPDELVVYNGEDLDIAKVQEEVNSCKDYTSLTLADKEAVATIRAHYESLTETQKASITNIHYLEFAENYIAVLGVLAEAQAEKAAAEEAKAAALAAQAAAEAAQEAAEAAKTEAETLKAQAAAAQTAAEEAQAKAVAAQTAAEEAQAKAVAAQAAAEAALASATATKEEVAVLKAAALAAKTEAETLKDQATAAQTAAEAAKADAESLRTQALAAQAAAEVARNEANTLKDAALAAKNAAEASQNATDADKAAATDAQAKAEAAQAAAEAALKAATAKANTAQVCMVVSIVFMVLTIAGGAALVFVKFKKAN